MNPIIHLAGGSGRKASLRGCVAVCRRLAWALLVLCVAGVAEAAPVDAATAQTAVNGWLKTDQVPLGAVLGQAVLRVETYSDAAGAPLYHVAYLSPQGFVIVAADDLVEPIVGFAPDGQYDPSASNPLGALVSSDVPGRVAAVRGTRTVQALAASPAAQSKWERLTRLGQGSSMVELGLLSVSDVRVAPVVKSLWSQQTAGGNACYNYYTPPFANGATANYPCGCVATAMAQLMRFWQHPKTGVGTPSFTISTNGVSFSRSLRGGNGSGGAYSWANMSLTNGSATTTAQRQAIGALCHDAGVSVGMSYAADGSSSDTLQSKTVFVSTFGYANAVKGRRVENSTSVNIGAGLNGMVNPNLDAGCPVILGITGPSGGHAVVCDGYGYNLATLYHHLNMGWAGSDDAWYNLPTIDAYYSFNSVYKCVYNVWTNGTGEIISGRVTDASGTPLQGVAVTAVRIAGGTYTATSDARGVYALARVPSSSSYTVSASKTGYNFTSQSVSTGTSSDYGSTAGNRWGINFVHEDSNAPAALSATALSPTQIALAWQKNASGDNVLVAWSTNGTFGTPSGAYVAGDAIAGGGQVLYNGSATSATHSGLAGNTLYAYRAWSVSSGPAYSGSLGASATTLCGVPFTEDFEEGGSRPSAWSEAQVSGSASWSFQTGGYNTHPSAAHGGSYNALLYAANTSDNKTLLATPPINFGNALQNAQLTFWHCMAAWSPDQDELRVYYKTSAGGTWTLLATYTDNVTAWTQRTIALPNPNGTYYIGFEGNAKYGYGVCIDDVAVTAEEPSDSFDAWAQTYCPGVLAAAAFQDDRDGDGVQNGFEYAFGTNWTAGALLLNMRSASGGPVVEIPKQVPETVPYVGIWLEMTRTLAPASWSSNGLSAVSEAGEPANREWFRPAASATNAFFRLRGTLR